MSFVGLGCIGVGLLVGVVLAAGGRRSGAVARCSRGGGRVVPVRLAGAAVATVGGSKCVPANKVRGGSKVAGV